MKNKIYTPTIIVIFALHCLLLSCQQDSWIEFSPEDNSWQASFPEVPKYIKYPFANTPNSDTMDCWLYEDSDENIAYYVGIVDYYQNTLHGLGSTEEIINSSLNGFIEEMKTTVNSKEELKIGKYKGIEAWTGRNKYNLRTAIRIFVVADSIYIMQVVSDDLDSIRPQINRFFNSMRILSEHKRQLHSKSMK